ncbi:MAG: class I SAM-dependent DNA methyltransferase [Deltaproteobacteria bacterium]|nr:class I SAM-dependent DNA methyltransferase [Deltaproteobacteria bacterium]
MRLSWNEIRANAIAFAREWRDEKREQAEAKTFWDEFFAVFGLRRRNVAAFEEPVKKLSGEWGHIDLFWPGTLIVEHKSRGKDLSQANAQAMAYIRGLIDSGRVDEAPRYVIVSDFERIALHDLEPAQDSDAPPTLEFPLGDLHKHIHAFGFIPGYQRHPFADQAPINIEAAERLGALRDALERLGYVGHDLERLLVRLLFCLFAEKTGIFDPRDAFSLYLQNHAREDGSDVGLHLVQIFELLDTPEVERSPNVPDDLRGLPYVNGELFKERLRIAHFDRGTKDALHRCARFDWSAISPAIFGALFQSVLDEKERRRIGAHYTSERNILKVVRSLFLDELRADFERAHGDRRRLKDLHERLSRLRLMDPACGCGNFLVISYRELRLLELDILQALDHGQQSTDIALLARVDVDQFFGIEIEQWPARIAEVAMWLMDHQMNLRVAEVFGRYFVRLPLRKSPTIICGNALRLDWTTILDPGKCSYVLGNPPFVGKKEQTDAQKEDLALIWGQGAGVLDYVTCWYRKAAAYIQGTRIRVGFVSTNSISQGEQVGVLWARLFAYKLKIHFAHTMFAWQSEARGRAHVHVVIIGFGAFDANNKTLFEYDTPKSEPHALRAKNINPYLADASDVLVTKRTRQVSGAPEISYGSMMIDKPRDAGDEEGLIIGEEERRLLLAECPALKPYVRRLYGGNEYINGVVRWCLWLAGAAPSLLRESPRLRARIDGVRRFRLASGRAQTRKLAATPMLFGEIRQPSTTYLLIPKVSSETRRYIPIGFLKPDVIASGSALIVPGASHYDFGVISSAMHNAWMRQVGGRMEIDYQYSSQIVYNNFVWPADPTPKQRQAVEAAAREVLAARKQFPATSLADLYDPVAMPAALARAHARLDRAVERCYRPQPFANDRQRIEHLFGLFEKATAPQM